MFQILKCYVQECKPTLSLFLKGHYIKDASATDLSSCLLSCCDQDDCDVVFLFDTKCFLITCATAEGCEPELREEKKFENSQLNRKKPKRKRRYSDAKPLRKCDSLTEAEVRVQIHVYVPVNFHQPTSNQRQNNQ